MLTLSRSASEAVLGGVFTPTVDIVISTYHLRQWKSRCALGELRSLWLRFRILFKSRVLFDRNINSSIVAVSKG
ncbi:hypothetical protein H6F76_12900 [Leptolyngbya sp. FACHB-321]|uniref:hypothetical protein n=1 Tax=Leptolyngbya sp. FACHB-321 TaxID=2692807 RepID=UPI0016865523|nr:hypothetical protein [Leptolyngbya sp. FACHB-321]MBD2035916.1 hypothetical protein [Leptolyngbya sp. FACHB-321]